jgi:hypothetical protein
MTNQNLLVVEEKELYNRFHLNNLYNHTTVRIFGLYSSMLCFESGCYCNTMVDQRSMQLTHRSPKTLFSSIPDKCPRNYSD